MPIVETDWQLLLEAWMHDPVDKALSIQNHENRARKYLSVALSNESFSTRGNDSIKSADINASIADRLPMPNAGRNAERAVGPEYGPIQVCHPISAQKHQLDEYKLDEAGVTGVINSIVNELPPIPKIRFLALWRLLPRALSARFKDDFIRLPADTRVPDHSLIQHADITSGIAAAQQGRQGYAILSVTIGPVQEFIQAARTVRDLWSGSAMLSWLIFQGMRPIIDSLGPTVFVFPSLREHPLVDIWLQNSSDDLKKLISTPCVHSRKAPSLPNRFVALVPYGHEGETALEFTRACEAQIQSNWQKLSNTVHGLIDREFSKYCPNWAQYWDDQMESFLEINTSICPVGELTDEEMAHLIGGTSNFSHVWKDAHRVRSMVESIPQEDVPRYQQDRAGEWQAQLEVSARIAEAQRTIRHIPQLPLASPAGPKCSLMGTYEQMGPVILQESNDFWADLWEHKGGPQYRIRKPDRLCAISLCKRFAAEHVLAPEFELEKKDVRFPDTATIAATNWLDEYSIIPEEGWNGRWIHQKQRCEDKGSVPSETVWSQIRKAKKDSSPPSYYAVLVMDADDMGLWLKGEKAPMVRDVIHEKLRQYFEQWGTDGLDATRPVNPSLHSSISEALNNFASVIVPSIVNRFGGTLIYSGGDDVLALLPVRHAVQCALELQSAFKGENGHTPGWTEIKGRHLLAMGSEATLSAGIAFVHYKEDLRSALQAARDAEKLAKSNGKDRLTLHFIRRSGDHPSCDLRWSLARWFQEAVNTFSKDVSDRWAYNLRREEPVLSDPDLPPEALDAEIKRLIARSDIDEDVFNFEDQSWWSYFCDHYSEDKPSERLKTFILLCLGASFVARGNDG